MADGVVIPAKRPAEDTGGPNKRFNGTNTAENTRQAEDLDAHGKPLCETDSKQDKIKRRKVVMLLGYCGLGYLGMQRNVGYKTIEEDLITALLKASLIKEEEFNQIQSLQFQRAARTDKGVSAVRQVVSLKLPENATVGQINEHLPAAIRVFAIRRVTKGFNSKSSCDARTYSYMTPSSAFSDTDDPDNFRISGELLKKIRETFEIYVGTHNFHNFTAKKKPQDPSAFRYIISFDCGEPFVREGVEHLVLKVKGQSFMLHQIRKMVGTAIGIVRGLTPPDTISRAWGEARFDLPIAPGLGLVLEQVHYDRYNTKYGKDGMHESLDWAENEEQIQSFKENFIDPVIIKTEETEKSMLTWVQTLSYHTFDVRQHHLHSSRANGESENTDLFDDNESSTSSKPGEQNAPVAAVTVDPSETSVSA